MIFCLGGYHAQLAISALTTNEHMNMSRYTHFRGIYTCDVCVLYMDKYMYILCYDPKMVNDIYLCFICNRCPGTDRQSF